MADGYRIIGAEMSPYSVKVRSYFHYKAIPHQWVLRNAASQAEFEKHAKIPPGLRHCARSIGAECPCSGNRNGP